MKEYKKILFSTIGNSDPMRERVDGPWLHCCRVEQPDATLLYLTKAMVENERDYQLYSRSLELLNEHLQLEGKRPIEWLPPIEREEVDQPHLHGQFEGDFQAILEQLHKQYPNAQILMNCSSGTPAMKNAMADARVSLPFANRISRLQVDNPGTHKENSQAKYLPDDVWGENKDNLPDARKRVHVIPDTHDALFAIARAKELITSHEYGAARKVLQSIKGELQDSDQVLFGLMGAEKRMMLTLNDARSKLRTLKYTDPLLDRKQDKQTECAELLLTMRIDIERGDYANMLRKVTPLFCSICESLLFISGISEGDLLLQENGKIYINMSAMQNKYPSLLAVSGIDASKGPSFSQSSFLVPMIREQFKNELELINNVSKVRMVERCARNDAAHTIVGINDAWVKQQTEKTTLDGKPIPGSGLSAESILKTIRALLIRLDQSYAAPEYWDTYTNMDHYLMDHLKLKVRTM